MKLTHLFAFAGGIVAGVAAGILFAPDSGVNTRAKIAQKLKEKGLCVDKESFDAFVEKVKSKLRDAFSEADLEAAVNDVLSEKE